MSIQTLHLLNFRNLQDVTISCGTQLNIFYGDNAAGKTSILEAIYYLGTGKSFRTKQLQSVLQNHQQSFSLFARISHQSTEIPVGISRDRNNIQHIRFNEKSIHSIATLSGYLPIQFIGSSSHRLLLDGPQARRQFLDWGLFYTNPIFYSVWKDYQKTLFQRNALLKVRASAQELDIWNQALAVLGEQLTTLRQRYLSEFLPHFQAMLSHFLPEHEIQLSYFPGFDAHQSLKTSLNQVISHELRLGYTLRGPHRADLRITTQQLSAAEQLSQGQQKLMSCALRLAQGLHLHATVLKTPCYLIDDLFSELDEKKQQVAAHVLSSVLRAQVFLTGTDKNILIRHFSPDIPLSMFHVKHGKVLSDETNQ